MSSSMMTQLNFNMAKVETPNRYLDMVDHPAHVKKLTVKQLGKLAEELRGLTNRLPRSEMEDLPSEEQFNEILLDAKKMLTARLFDGEGS